MPDTQLEAYVALNGSSLTIEGQSIKVRNFRQRTPESVTAEFHGAKDIYIGRCDNVKANEPSETWEILSLAGRCSVICRIRVENQAITRV